MKRIEKEMIKDVTCLEQITDKNWTLICGDSNITIKLIPDNKIGLSVFSPPFAGMYSYSNSKHDIGNCKNAEELINQFKFMMPELLRITMPGRICAIHLCQEVAYKHQDGYIGIKDFRGKIIKAMEESDWIYYGEVCIDKNPQIKAIRTRDIGLSFETSVKDSAKIHPALADYLLQFKKKGENPEPVKAGMKSKRYNNPDGWLTTEEWIEWAAPVWYRQSKYYPGGIRETDVLNVRQARDEKDEKHLAPLQLGVIERAVKMWSNPGDIVYSPFAGIGSEGYVALKLSRKFIGCELKKSYFDVAVKNLKSVKGAHSKLNIAQAL
jgi:DNA modification methylase